MEPIISKNIRLRYPELFSVDEGAIIDDFCYISTKLIVGKYSHIASGCSIAGGKNYLCKIGDFCSLSSGVKVWCSSSDFVNDLVILNMGIDTGARFCSGDVIFENYTGVGTNSVIMPNNTIPEGTVIGGMSWVKAGYKFEPWMVYAGIPIRPIRKRNKKNVLKQVEILKEKLL